MKDQLLIITKIKKTICYLDKIVDNFPNREKVLKERLGHSIFELLEVAYTANNCNIERRKEMQQTLLIKIKMIDFYLKLTCDKKIINYKRYEKIGEHLLDITRLVYAWIKSGYNYEAC